MNNKNVVFTLSILALVGCGGNSSEPEVNDPVLITELSSSGVPILDNAKQSLKPLKTVQNVSFETHYKNGIYLSTVNDDGIRYLETTTADASPSSSSTSGRFSSTITQESGVDEADRIKYDGEYLYIANNHDRFSSILEDQEESDTKGAYVRVLKRNTDNSMEEVNRITLAGDEFETISGLYLGDNTLSVVSNSLSYGIADTRLSIWNPGPQTFNLSLFDVSAPDASSKQTEFEIDGYLISSRRVDNHLIVVSSYSPSVPELNFYPQTDEEKASNYKLISDQDLNTLLPQYKDQQGNSLPLVSAENCFIPEDATNRDGHNGIVTLTTINLDDPSQLSSVCVNASTQGIYATPQSVYMYGSVDAKQSVIHKFSVNGQNVSYQASTSFDGHLFGRGQSQLRFSEQGDYLRIVTTEFTDDSTDRFEHKLKVFETQSGSNALNLVAELPNENQPEKIGKENEDIYAVRYFEDKAFIVTFERIDPLYVINLEDNTAPLVESELEIIGYSSYLHPISDNLLLGIGQNIDPNRFAPIENNETTIAVSTPENSSVNEQENEIVEGAKIALFDVSGEARLVKEFVFEGGYTPAEYNYHALTYLARSDTEHIFALPVETWSTEYSEEHGYDIWTSHSQLQLFEVNEQGSSGELIHKGSVSPNTSEADNYGSWEDRAVIHDNLIYYVHGAGVWQSLWDDPKQVFGPY